MNAHEIWVPLSMFIGLAVVLSLWVWFRYKAKRDLQITIRTAIEKGQATDLLFVARQRGEFLQR